MPFIWMGSIEDILGFWIPVGLVDPAAFPKEGTTEGDLTYFEVDPYVPRMLRRNHEGGLGRSARTTAWIMIDGIRDMLARVRADLVLAGMESIVKIVRLDRFAKVAVDDLDVYLRETVHGAKFGSPTDSGRQVFVNLMIDDVTCPVLFDPV